MVALNEIFNIIDLIGSQNESFNLHDYYKFIYSVLNSYSNVDKSYLSSNSYSYKFLKAFFNDSNFIENINKNNNIFFPLCFGDIDEKVCIDVIRKTVMFFTEDENFVEKIIEEYKNYNFFANYKEEMIQFIDKEFEHIIGIDNIKNDLNDLIVLITNNKIRKQKKLSETSISMHMVFSGNPGTGKTTIARLIGKMYCHLGLIKTDKFIEVARQDLVAEYVGQTAVKTAKVLEEAKGGILFIDEAYSLVSGSDNDYGKECIETILKFMEDNRDNTIIIVAGYEKEIEEFVNSNPGLRSRFNKFFKFKNYEPLELYEIFKVFCEKDDYVIDVVEEKKIKNKFTKIDVSEPNFSNARYVRNVYDKTILNQVKRIDKENITDNIEFMKIKSEDVVL